MQGFNTDFEANKKAEDFLSEGYLVPVVEAVGQFEAATTAGSVSAAPESAAAAVEAAAESEQEGTEVGDTELEDTLEGDTAGNRAGNRCKGAERNLVQPKKESPEARYWVQQRGYQPAEKKEKGKQVELEVDF